MKNNKITISYNKALKLNNVLIKKVDINSSEGLNKEVLQMENYLKNKGAQPAGPLIQYTYVEGRGDNINVAVKFIRQANTFIHNIEVPYEMESVIRVKNCIYARYTGEESKLKFAYDKINLIAFEEDITLKGDSYTIYVNSSEDGIIADVFMEISDNE